MVAHSTQCPLSCCVCFLMAWKPMMKTKKNKKKTHIYASIKGKKSLFQLAAKP